MLGSRRIFAGAELRSGLGRWGHLRQAEGRLCPYVIHVEAIQQSHLRTFVRQKCNNLEVGLQFEISHALSLELRD
jgi:hypothetical protein